MEKILTILLVSCVLHSSSQAAEQGNPFNPKKIVTESKISQSLEIAGAPKIAGAPESNDIKSLYQCEVNEAFFPEKDFRERVEALRDILKQDVLAPCPPEWKEFAKIEYALLYFSNTDKNLIDSKKAYEDFEIVLEGQRTGWRISDMFRGSPFDIDIVRGISTKNIVNFVFCTEGTSCFGTKYYTSCYVKRSFHLR